MAAGNNFTQKVPCPSAVRTLVQMQRGRGKILRNNVSRTENCPFLQAAAGNGKFQQMGLESASKALFFIFDFRQSVPARRIIHTFVNGKGWCGIGVAFKSCQQCTVFFSVMRKTDAAGIHGARCTFSFPGTINYA